MRPLFSPQGSSTTISNTFEEELRRVARPVIQQWLREGFSVREIQAAAMGCIYDIVVSEILARKG